MANQVLYGFHNLESMFNDRITDQNIPLVNSAIEASVAAHNEQVNALLGLFAQPTELFQTRYLSANAARLQPLDENGRALPIQVAGHYEIGFPIRDAGIANGATYKARAKMTIAEANRVMSTMLIADRVWMRDQALAALFTAAAYDFEDPLNGTLSVKPLATTSGDTQTYLLNGDVMPSTDEHHLAQAAAIADASDPYPIIYDELTEHPENGGDVVAFIPAGLRAATELLAGFHQNTDPDITLPSTVAQLTGALGTTVPGTVIGKHDAGVWIVEWKSLPANYIVATMTEADAPLAMRQEPEPELQGFYRVPEDRNDHPFYEQQWARHAGFGAFNRVGALVYRIGNGTYAAPTGYTAPIP